ncbi:MAG TPA: DUF4097 family beta strand repeat-containing protein [Bryobacteraceae bacterium]|nr:DUF4097 family beta strand repeat-containing protein [Bryobacteraceae bacterium]
MATWARWLPLMAAMLLQAGCVYVGDLGDGNAYRQDFHSTHPLDPGGRVSVESFNGSIEVAGWEQNSVEVNGTKSASSRSALDEIKIDVSAAAGSVHIRAIRPPERFRNMGVHFSIRVPRQTLLELVSSSNGRIEVDDLEGNARLQTSNGAIRILRVKGDVEAQTSNGGVEAEGLSGGANLHTSNGSIRAETSGGSFEAVTSNGSIVARLSDPATTWPVRARSSNGRIELTFEARQLPEVRASTNNSSILVRLPASANARVRAHTSHSTVSSEFDELRNESGRRHSELDGTIGRGGPLIDLETNNGSIRIAKL